MKLSPRKTGLIMCFGGMAALGIYVAILFLQEGGDSITYSIGLAVMLSSVVAAGAFVAITGIGPDTDLSVLRWPNKVGATLLLLFMLVGAVVGSVKVNSYFERRGYSYPGHNVPAYKQPPPIDDSRKATDDLVNEGLKRATRGLGGPQ